VQAGIVLTIILAMAVAGIRGQTTAAADNQRQAAIAPQQQDTTRGRGGWRTLKSHPANAEAYAHLGLLEARQEHYAEAVPLYRKALALNPAMPGLRLDLGLSLFKSGALKEAIQTFTPLLKNEPGSSSEKVRLTTLIGLAHYAGRIRGSDSLSESRPRPATRGICLPPGFGAIVASGPSSINASSMSTTRY